VYSGHVQNATVARISPSGYYCASADISGTGEYVDALQRTPGGEECIVLTIRPVRIWDTVGEDQTLKGEYKVISGRMYAPSHSLSKALVVLTIRVT
jgi:WD repeat-containing protein 1 (actin-interacting protein 1)